MQCLNPTVLRNPNGGRMFAACGKCSACLENRRRSWKFRCFCERAYSPLCTHVTLTFDDDFLEDNVCRRTDLQKYFKRLRNHGLVFRYIAIGEYGTIRQRKHYHIGLFVHNCSPNDFEKVREICDACWPYGITYYKPLRDRTIGYILHYHIRPKEVNNKKTLFLYSKGLGSEWFDNPEVSNYIVNSKSVMVQGHDGQFYNLPRYYRKLMTDIDFSQYYEKVGKDTFIKYVEKIAKKPYFELSKSELERYKFSFAKLSSAKIKKYNNQDKL